MKSIFEFAHALGLRGKPATDAADLIEARDAEHRAEVERLKSELAGARGLIKRLAEVHSCPGCKDDVAKCLAAPPPAESTPVQATPHGEQAPTTEKPLRRPPGGFLLDEKDRYKPNICPKCLGRKIDRQGRECRYCSWKPQPAPPDDIRERGVKCECGAGRNHVMYGVCELAAKTAEDLTFEQFAEVNRRRCESYNGFGESLQPSSQYTEAHWALSIASEAGEVADAILGWSGLKRSKAGKTKEDVGRELADVVTYCDLLASKLGFRLSRLIVAKFNEINERCGFGNRFAIGSHPAPAALEAKGEPGSSSGDRCAMEGCRGLRVFHGPPSDHAFVDPKGAKP